ncbi:MAG: DUF4422 domain-containing protein [Alphaproteobacteria bacterium]|nr:DUF4422 domain-containing protein [Alphaproteobacteria bacterium]
MGCDIFVVYHNKKPQINSDILSPIDACIIERNHIAEKNKHFCELTALYWIWKNVTSDVVGLFHYRRLLNLNNHVTRIRNLKQIDNLNLTQDRINQLMQKYDVILPVKRPKKIKSTSPTIYEYYAKHHFKEDMDIALDVITKKYPMMKDIAHKIIKEEKQNYVANIILAKKALFDEYAQWLFDVLFDVEKEIHADVLKRNDYQQRVYGFLAERLLGVFIAYKQQTSNVRVLEAPMIFVETDVVKFIKYKFRQIKRRTLTLIGLGRKEWYYRVD